jgi:hypothetical protein
MTIIVNAYANADDVLIAWQPDTWPDDWVGFQLERRNDTTQEVTVLVNRIPPQAGEGPVQPTGVSSAQSPIRRCIWTDHSVVATDNVSYRVTAIKGAANGAFAPDATSASAWTAPLVASGDAGGGLEAYFNRGTLMSQIVSRFVNGDVSDPSLRKFLDNLATPGFQARLYLSGDALHEILGFLRDADRRGSTIHAAIYEMNDQELVDAHSKGHCISAVDLHSTAFDCYARRRDTQPSQVLQNLAVQALDLTKRAKRNRQNLGGDNFYGNKLAVLRSDATNAFRALSSQSAGDTTALAELIEPVFSAHTAADVRHQASRELLHALKTTWKEAGASSPDATAVDFFPPAIIEKTNRTSIVVIGRQMNGCFGRAGMMLVQ